MASTDLCRDGELRDRNGEVFARLEGEALWLRGAPGRELIVTPAGLAGAAHPIFGRCARLESGGQLCSLMGAVEWSAPASIPPVAEPARLPPLCGTMLLNVLAHCAAATGLSSLRYVGPYPTHALYASLLQCFTPSDGEEVFTAGAAELMMAPRMAEIAVDFAPAPFERWWLSPRLGVQARGQVERVFVDGASFERHGSGGGVRRLVERHGDGDSNANASASASARGTPSSSDTSDADSEVSLTSHLAAELWFGDRRWATVAEVSPDGSRGDGPRPLPSIDDPIVGQEVPLPLRRALAAVIAEAVPAPLAPLIAPLLERATLRWGDAGTAAVRVDDAGDVLLHAALWLTLRAHGAGRLALAMAEALTPWAMARAVGTAQAALQD